MASFPANFFVNELLFVVGINTDCFLIFCGNVEMLFSIGDLHMNASSGINKDTGKENRFLSPQRVTITVPAMTLKKLLRRSLVEGRSVSNLAAFLLEQSLEGDPQD